MDWGEPPAYRVFFFDDEGRIKTSKALKCTTDDEATVEARRVLDGRTLKLYDGCRLVMEISKEAQSS